jgi:hypothetical protein
MKIFVIIETDKVGNYVQLHDGYKAEYKAMLAAATLAVLNVDEHEFLVRCVEVI